METTSISNTEKLNIHTNQPLSFIKDWLNYFLKKWVLIISVAFLFGICGITYAWLQKPVYKAEMLFAVDADNSSKIGSLSGLASQFMGLDLAAGNIFEGDNVIEFLKTRTILEQTLLTKILIDGKSELLINKYIQFNDLNKKWAEDKKIGVVQFDQYPLKENRVRDSLIGKIIKQISSKALKVERPDKKLSFIKATYESNDEIFAKLFLENLAINAVNYYTAYKINKSKQNVEILQRQVDSVEAALTGNVYEIASSNDLNVNPTKQVVRAHSQRKQIDVQVNGLVYGELLKNLELSKMALRKETPLIQVIDKPVLPLEMKKLGRLMGGILFAFIGGLLILIYLYLKRIFLLSNNN